MTMDNGMDVSPSWEELREERDALAAQMGLLSEALRKIDADLEGRNFLENSSLRDTARAAIEALPATSLARLRGEVRRQVAEEWELALPRLKAEWQADLMEQTRRVRNYSNPHDVFEAIPVVALEGELRRQAEEPIE